VCVLPAGIKCLHLVPPRYHQCPEKLKTFKMCHGFICYIFLLYTKCKLRGSGEKEWPILLASHKNWVNSEKVTSFQILHKVLRNVTSVSPESSTVKRNCREIQWNLFLMNRWENDFRYTRFRLTKWQLCKITSKNCS
jgi:hypothetical protein